MPAKKEEKHMEGKDRGQWGDARSPEFDPSHAKLGLQVGASYWEIVATAAGIWPKSWFVSSLWTIMSLV